MMRKIGLLILASFTLGVSSCQEKENKGYVFKTELSRLGSSADLRLKEQNLNFVDNSYAWTSDINIESLKIPIVAIALGTVAGNKMEPIYTCDVDCTVDLMGPELTNLLKDASIGSKGKGTFDLVTVSAINSGKTTDLWEGKVKASFVLGGVTYYTKSNDTISTTGPAEEAIFRYNGGRMDSFLPVPITLSENESSAVPINMKLFFDPLYLVLGYDASKVSQGVTYSIGSGPWCIGTNDGPKLCVARMQVTASTEEAPPTRERYIINESGLLSLLIDSNSNILGGSFAPKFKEGQLFRGFNGGSVSDNAVDNRPWASGSLAIAETNSDGTFSISNFPRSDLETPNPGGGFFSSQFQRASHSGTFINSIRTEFNYTAEKL